jgi:hypothetical protein
VLEINKKDLKNRLKAERAFVKSKRNFYHYLKSNSSDLDDFYFLRASAATYYTEHPDWCLHYSITFSTPFTEIAGQLYGAEQFMSRLTKELGDSKEYLQDKTSGFEWAGTKTELVELAVALQNYLKKDGKPLSQKDLMEGFEKAFGVSLRNYRQIINEIHNRKDKQLFIKRLIGLV